MGAVTVFEGSSPVRVVSIPAGINPAVVQVTGQQAPQINITVGGARGLPGDAGGGGIVAAAGTGLVSSGTMQFANSNGISFGISGQTLTASVAPQTEQTQSRFNITLAGITAGVMAMISSGVMTLAAANNITLSQDGNAVTISGPATHAQQTGISGISAGAGSLSAGTLIFSNSNGMSFGLNGSTLTGSHNGLTTAALSGHSHGNPSLNLTNLSGTTASNSAGLTLSLSAGSIPGATSFSNLNGVSFGLAGSTITASHNGLTTAMQSQMSSNYMSTSERGNYFATNANTFANSTHSHGNPTLNLTNLSGTTASGSNGFTLSISAAAGGGGADGYNILAAGTQTATTAGTVNFANSNGMSFGMSNSSQITASYTVPTIPGATSFSNSNGITFGLNGSTITASHNGLTTAMASNASTGFMLTGERANYLTTAALSGHSHGITLNLTNINGTTGGNSQGINLSLSAVVPAQSVQPVAYSAANGSANFSTLTFANSNGVSFSTGTQGVYGTVKTDYLTTAMQSQLTSNYMSTSERANYFGTAGNTFANSTHSHGNPTLNLTNISGTTASNSAGLTLSLSAAAPGAGGGVAIVGGTLTATSGTITLSGSNGISVFNAGNEIRFSLIDSHHVEGLMLSGNNLGTAYSIMSSGSQTINFAGAISGSQNGNAFTISGPTIPGATSFSNSNGITFGLNGSTITASHNGLTTAMASNASTAFAGTGSGFTGGAAISATLTHNTLGLSLNLSHPAWLTTAAQSGHSHGNPTLNLTNISGTTASNSAGLTLSLSAAAGGGGAMSISAGASSAALGSMVFSNLNGVSFGLNGSTLTASAAGGGGGGAALSAGTQSIGSGTVNFANSNGITFGMSGSSQITASIGAMSYLSGINLTILTTSTNNTMTLSAANPTAGSTQPGWDPFLPQAEMIGGAQGAGTLYMCPIFLPVPVSFNYCEQVLQLSNASNSSGSWTLSMSAGLYSKHATTDVLHLLASGSRSYNASGSGSIGAYSTWGGVRKVPIPLTSTLGAGNYFVGIWSRTTTGGAAGQTLNQMLMSQNNVSFSGFLGSTTAAENKLINGLGRYSVSFSTAMPESVTMSHIQGNSSILQRPPIFNFTV